MTPQIQQAVAALSAAHHVIALTGAGISVESGIPPFRGKGGLWEKIDPLKYGHIDAFHQDPAGVWQVLFADMSRVMTGASPNDGHKGLSRLEQMGLLTTVITQNVDGLHQKAGNHDVIEFHGSFAVQRCSDCSRRMDSDKVGLDRLPPRCACGGIMRPDVVMFGEPIPMNHLERAHLLASRCDVMLVVGTSATVEPAASLPVIAKHGGALIIEINPAATPLQTNRISDLVLPDRAGTVMNRLIRALESAAA